MKIEAED